jgi:hypothetical protein
MVKTIFSGKSSRIIRILLSEPSKAWRTRELSSEAKVSLGWVSNVTNKLIDMGFLVRDRSMRLRLRKENELLRRWASFYDLGVWKHKTYFARGSLYDIGSKFVETTKKDRLRYAFTGPFAVDLLTKYIRSAEIHIYLTNMDDIPKIVNNMNLEIAMLGGNIIFLIADDDSVFYGLRKITDDRVSEATIVSDVQLILDLYNYTDRTREAAERLLSKEHQQRSEHRRLIKRAREYFEQKGLIFTDPQTITNEPRPDLVLFDPSIEKYLIIECKTSIAKLDSVDRLKSIVSSFGPKGKGVLIAPSITKAAMKELSKIGLEFEYTERLENGIHNRRS